MIITFTRSTDTECPANAESSENAEQVKCYFHSIVENLFSVGICDEPAGGCVTKTRYEKSYKMITLKIYFQTCFRHNILKYRPRYHIPFPVHENTGDGKYSWYERLCLLASEDC